MKIPSRRTGGPAASLPPSGAAFSCVCCTDGYHESTLDVSGLVSHTWFAGRFHRPDLLRSSSLAGGRGIRSRCPRATPGREKGAHTTIDGRTRNAPTKVKTTLRPSRGCERDGFRFFAYPSQQTFGEMLTNLVVARRSSHPPPTRCSHAGDQISRHARDLMSNGKYLAVAATIPNRSLEVSGSTSVQRLRDAYGS
jgi:hypothetical protein